jgi:hypothetical protein
VSLRWFNYHAYDTVLTLPGKYAVEYVVKMKLTKWDNEAQTKIVATASCFGNATFAFKHYGVITYASRTVLLANMRQITPQIFHMFPDSRLLDMVPVEYHTVAKRHIQRAINTYRRELHLRKIDLQLSELNPSIVAPPIRQFTILQRTLQSHDEA